VTKCILATAICVSVCLSVRRILTLLHGSGYNLGCPLDAHCWVDLQSMHGFRCYDYIHICKLIALYTANAYSAEREMSASACTRSMTGFSMFGSSFCCLKETGK